MIEAAPSSGSSEVAERALDVLLAFLDTDSDLGVTEIARRLGLEKSRVHRFLVALKRKGFVVDNPRTRRYHLGFRVLELANALMRQVDLEQRATPLLRELRDRIGETAGLAVRVGHRRVHLLQVESLQEIRQSFPVGVPLPLHVGAAAKVLLAFLPDEERAAALAASLAAGPTVPDFQRAAFLAQLPQVHAQGWATSLGERVAGSRSIAAPVWGWRGDVFALVTSGPSTRFTDERAVAAVPTLLEVARRLTWQLGGQDHLAQH
jgi:DNA-binding IclR family transcriptional regulator